MRIARSAAVPSLFLLIAALSLTGCGKKTWWNPFGSSPKSQPAAGAPGEGPATADETAPTAPPVGDISAANPPSPLPLPGDQAAGIPSSAKPATDASGSIPAATPIRKPAVLATELEMIHFDYDKADLRSDAIPILDHNAEWLISRPGIQIQIEGHCDERGTIEYNLALGQRRADAVREYLIKKGIDPNSSHTISYGKERPLAFGDTDQDHAMNRRAQFLIFSE